jgi:hypothetical protein
VKSVGEVREDGINSSGGSFASMTMGTYRFAGRGIVLFWVGCRFLDSLGDAFGTYGTMTSLCTGIGRGRDCAVA